ncbi:MAG: arginyltransferase [Pseudomonadota bacterium]
MAGRPLTSVATPPRSTTRLATFASTDLQPCPYLADRMERRLFTIVHGADADQRHEVLMQAGFRRSQNVLYRPICPGCLACRSVRIPVRGFAATRSLRRVEKRNADLVARMVEPLFAEEHYRLFRRYIESRHGDGGMADMDRGSFRRMIETSPVTTRLIELRDGAGRLVAASLSDEVESGLSGVYKYFDPSLAERSLGTLVILRHIDLARSLGLSFVYLGYWIAGSRKMAYKARFRPLEILEGDRWVPFALPATDESATD